MRPVRRLTVRRDPLADLTPDQLLAVAGAAITRPNCELPTFAYTCTCMTHVPPPSGMC